jgi:TFIIF-interacting CTD phosphatase-like protein
MFTINSCSNLPDVSFELEELETLILPDIENVDTSQPRSTHKNHIHPTLVGPPSLAEFELDPEDFAMTFLEPLPMSLDLQIQTSTMVLAENEAVCGEVLQNPDESNLIINLMSNSVFSPYTSREVVAGHINEVLSELYYSRKHLKGPSSSFLNSRYLRFEEKSSDTSHTKPTLLLELNEFLIILCEDNEEFSHPATYGCDTPKTQLTYKIRPHTTEFLKKLRESFEIGVFTSLPEEISLEIMAQLDPSNQYFQYLIHSEYCMRTKSGRFVKDLRIIQNRSLDHMVILDPHVSNFGLQLSNGVPVVKWTGDKNDNELIYLQQYLSQLAQSSCITEELKVRFHFTEISLNEIANIIN